MHRKKNIIREYVEAFGVAIIAALILRMLVIQAFRIPTGSMKDTLLVGDMLLVNKFVYGAQTIVRIPYTDIKIPSIRFPALKEPGRGDIIVFKYPKDEKLDYIKRCIALSGDTLEIREGNVFVNGQPEGDITFLEKAWDPEESQNINYYQVNTPDGYEYTIRKYVGTKSRYYNYGPVVVPEDHLFMMGDNRDNSADSRYWGFMPKKNLVGQALVIYFSWDGSLPSWQIFHKIRWDRLFGIIR
ncbi:signal peptidase I [candidate division KSB1 bacterium]|nr:signal peptidase I [candidate division KSB1 bacterium]